MPCRRTAGQTSNKTCKKESQKIEDLGEMMLSIESEVLVIDVFLHGAKGCYRIKYYIKKGKWKKI